jgi:hypothetical protein
MRQAVIVGVVNGRWARVTGPQLSVQSLRMLVGDRRDNGEAFPAETVVRLPRSMQVNYFGASSLMRSKPYPQTI